jgi:hypothetical protein
MKRGGENVCKKRVHTVYRRCRIIYGRREEGFRLTGGPELSDPEAKKQWYTVSWFQYEPFVKKEIFACDTSLKREI